MQTRYSFLLFSAFASVLYASKVLAVTCTATPECVLLGYKYSKEECPRGGLKCPTGDGYYCPTPRPKCNVGDIFYADNTCVAAANHDNSKTVLGIVVYVTDDGRHGQIMAPWWIDTNGNKSSSGVGMFWGEYPYENVSRLPNSTDTVLPEADFDSCGNTTMIAPYGSKYPAIGATRKYAPTTETKGKWCLPAAGVLRNIQNNWNTINTAVNKVGSVSDFGNHWVWSSSEGAPTYTAWFGRPAVGGLVSSDDRYISNYVFPVLEF